MAAKKTKRRQVKAAHAREGRRRPPGVPESEMVRLPPDTRAEHTAGRPSLLTDAVATTICRFLRGGMSRGGAGAKAGVDRTTIAEWIRRGEGREKDRPGNERYAAFAAAVHSAEADCEEAMLRRCLDSTDGRVQLALLERRHRADWQASQRVEAALSVDTTSLREMVQRIADAVSAPDDEP
jgi:hypothetical protein